MPGGEILIQGKNHDWSDVKLYLGPQEISGFTAVSWGAAQEKSLTHAGGVEPDGVAHGKRTYKCDFTLKLAAAIKFEKIAKAAGKTVFDYAPFVIIVAYGDKVVEGDFVEVKYEPTQVTKILDVCISEDTEDIADGTTTIARKYTCLAGDIQ